MSRRYEEKSELNNSLEFTRELVKSARHNKVDIFDFEALADRIDRYFELCVVHDVRPTVGDLSIALGLDHHLLSKIASGNHKTSPKYSRLPPECVDEIKNAYNTIKAIIEQQLTNGQINPVSGIFLLKSMGLKDYNNDFDKMDSGTPAADLKEIKQKYLECLPPPKTAK